MYAKLEGKRVTKQGKVLRSYHHILIDREFKNDCAVWMTFLLNQNVVNRKFVDFNASLVEARDIGFYTDASKNPKLRFGCYFDRKWTFGQWERGFIATQDPSIAYLELYALCVGILMWRKELMDQKILIHCDNVSVVHMVNGMTSSCRNCMYLLRILMLDNLLCNWIIQVKYVATKQNYLADNLSRLRIDDFLSHTPVGTSILPDRLPTDLWPLSRICRKKVQ